MSRPILNEWISNKSTANYEIRAPLHDSKLPIRTVYPHYKVINVQELVIHI